MKLKDTDANLLKRLSGLKVQCNTYLETIGSILPGVSWGPFEALASTWPRRTIFALLSSRSIVSKTAFHALQTFFTHRSTVNSWISSVSFYALRIDSSVSSFPRGAFKAIRSLRPSGARKTI
ncbi:hypothetical protein B566_EDAN001401 [Ephemera danica]|nr:hypothetical protein B566_EDAN001401 [Ephemera danica]